MDIKMWFLPMPFQIIQWFLQDMPQVRMQRCYLNMARNTVQSTFSAMNLLVTALMAKSLIKMLHIWILKQGNKNAQTIL